VTEKRGNEMVAATVRSVAYTCYEGKCWGRRRVIPSWCTVRSARGGLRKLCRDVHGPRSWTRRTGSSRGAALCCLAPPAELYEQPPDGTSYRVVYESTLWPATCRRRPPGVRLPRPRPSCLVFTVIDTDGRLTDVDLMEVTARAGAESGESTALRRPK
jgi:hypothetical protein